MRIETVEFEWDVFVSDNRGERAIVHPLAEQLQECGLSVSFDSRDDSSEAIEERVAKSRFVVLLLCPEALAREWVAMDRTLALMGDRDAPKPIPVLLEPVDQYRIPAPLRRDCRIDLTPHELLAMQQCALALELVERALPEGPLVVGPTDVAGAMVPGEYSGSEVHGYFPVDEARIGLVVADRCGHGIAISGWAPALLTNVRCALKLSGSLSRVYEVMNAEFCEDLLSGSFVGMFLGIFDVKRGLLEYVNAGFGGAYHYRRAAGEIRELKAHAPALGIIDELSGIEVARVQFDPADRLVLCSDGVLEASSPTGEQFGSERLRGVIVAARDDSPTAMLEQIATDCRTHGEGAKPRDDQTIVVLRYDPSTSIK